MFQQLKKLAGHSGLYGLGLLGSGIASIVLTPMFLHALSLREYGMMELLSNISSILSSILLLGAATVLPKVYACDCETEDDRRRMLTSILLFSAIMSAMLLLLSCFLAEPVSMMLFGAGRYGVLVRMAAAASAILVTQSMIMIFLRVKQWPVKFMMVTLSQVTLMLLLNLHLVGGRHEGVMGVQISSVISCCISLFIGLYLVRNYLIASLSVRLVKHVLRLSIPLVPMAIAPWVLNFSDRYFLNHYVGLSETGLYSAGYKLGMVGMILLINAFQLSWGPFFFAHDDNDASAICAIALKYYALVLCGFGLIFSVFASDILRLISKPEFWSAGQIVPYIALSYVFYGMQFYTAPLFIRANKGKWLSLIMGGTAVINLGLNWLLIPRIGITGAMVSTLVCFSVLFVASFILAGRLFPARYDYAGFVKILGVCIVLFLLFRNIPTGSAWVLLAKVSVIPAFFLSLVLLRFFEPVILQRVMLGMRLSAMRNP